jgi:acyl carrier protein
MRRELESIRRDLPPTWDDDADFQKDMGLDSLDLVEMVARLEQFSGIYVPDDDIPKLKSISTTAEYVRMRLSKTPPRDEASR